MKPLLVGTKPLLVKTGLFSIQTRYGGGGVAPICTFLQVSRMRSYGRFERFFAVGFVHVAGPQISFGPRVLSVGVLMWYCIANRLFSV